MVVRRTFGVSHPRLVTMSAPSDPGSEDLLRSGPPPGEVEVDQCPADGISKVLKDLRAIQMHAKALYQFANREIDNIEKNELEGAAELSFETSVLDALTMLEYSANAMIQAQIHATNTRKRKLRSGESYTMRFVAARTTREPRSDDPVSLQDPSTSSHHEFNTSVPNRTTGTDTQIENSVPDLQAPSPAEESQHIKRMRASVWDVAFVSGLYDAGPDQLD